MHVVYINPNATEAMTQSVVDVAQRAVPFATISGLTNLTGPPAIEGAADGEAAIPGVLELVDKAQSMGADAIVIACFDDTGLDRARAAARCPVLGIGQSAFTMGAMLGQGFSVVTSVTLSVPVIQHNIKAQGFSQNCLGVHASGIAVLDIDAGSQPVREKLAAAIVAAQRHDNSDAVVLGCAGMAPLLGDLEARTGIKLIDGVAGSALLAVSAATSQ
ncbi:aspartate/glutamate racemase family protein [Pacificibacter marinus]|uniref:Asp/Glu/Hydantoin racemase n=1 Tax=Pacificibacter marinus TaxID=658057 RepID=A0A1Y5RF00_9RHOB|nr:aspartate/glutamate racemase family protein [Pacificibacter marinus]SEK22156.1 allantoin racemase [Pacificibacter marinus]SLN15562.1 Asp/Glu/Hydantoin racemase [Pacificibacter marinus]